MTKYFAEIGTNAEVLRVVVCDDPQWLVDRLGGTWVETRIDAPPEAYAGIGMHDVKDFSRFRFLPKWVQPTHAENAYPKASQVFYNGRAWLSMIDANAHAPGVSGWREYAVKWPEWVQPSGAHDAYLIGERVTYRGLHYRCLIDANVWDPVTYPPGWSREDIIVPEREQ